VAAVTVFSAARPRCNEVSECQKRVLESVRALASSTPASLEPNGFGPIEPSPIVDFWHQLPRHLLCLKPEYEHLSNGRDLFLDVEFTSFSPMGSFAVARGNILSAPLGWLRRAAGMMSNRSESVHVSQCCGAGRTCVPWLMERLWPMLLTLPQRTSDMRCALHSSNCNPSGRRGVAPDVAKPLTSLSRSARLVATAMGTSLTGHLADRLAGAETRESAGAVRLRFDVQRVARIARFTNELSDVERTVLYEQLILPGSQPVAANACVSQLCAIHELMRMARLDQGTDFSMYLASAVNGTRAVSAASERGKKRCRTMLLDPSLLPRGVDRIQWSDTSISSHVPPVRDEHLLGRYLHGALSKVYLACLLQMVKDPRWAQRPFVYGFARTLGVEN